MRVGSLIGLRMPIAVHLAPLFLLPFLVVLPGSSSNANDPYLAWYHFIPRPFDWMNDPNGPFYDPSTKKYHLFYQYSTPRLWGHAVSYDLLNWQVLPIALYNDKHYDVGGVWSGSVTMTQEGPLLLYTCVAALNWTNQDQHQCMARPANLSDPDLVQWTKSDKNPLITTPWGRDPTTGWTSSADGDSSLRIVFAYGTTNHKDGAAIEWKSLNSSSAGGGGGQFTKWTRDGFLSASSTTGMWECPDFYKLPQTPPHDDDDDGPSVTHVLKASLEQVDRRDYWVTGTYSKNKFSLVSGAMGTPSQRFDHGPFYASKSFFDQKRNRQVVFGWLPEERPVNANAPQYGWAGVQSLPRVVQLADNFRIKTPPITEVTSLRITPSHKMYSNLQSVQGRFLIPTTNNLRRQIEIIAKFKLVAGADCGLSVAATPEWNQYTDVGIKVQNSTAKHAYIDTTKSSRNPITAPYRKAMGGPLMSEGMSLNLRVFVDGSVVEAFYDDGYSVITRRIYPLGTDAVGVGVYNNEAALCEVESVETWWLRAAFIQ